jgi:hypothetical protein
MLELIKNNILIKKDKIFFNFSHTKPAHRQREYPNPSSQLQERVIGYSYLVNQFNELGSLREQSSSNSLF